MNVAVFSEQHSTPDKKKGVKIIITARGNKATILYCRKGAFYCSIPVITVQLLLGVMCEHSTLEVVGASQILTFFSSPPPLKFETS